MEKKIIQEGFILYNNFFDYLNNLLFLFYFILFKKIIRVKENKGAKGYFSNFMVFI